MTYTERFNEVAGQFHPPVGDEVEPPEVNSQNNPHPSDACLHLSLIDEYLEGQSEVNMKWMAIRGYLNV